MHPNSFHIQFEPGTSWGSLRIAIPYDGRTIRIDIEEPSIDPIVAVLNFAESLASGDDDQFSLLISPECTLKLGQVWHPSETIDDSVICTNGHYVFRADSKLAIVSQICGSIAQAQETIENAINFEGWRYCFPEGRLRSVMALLKDT